MTRSFADLPMLWVVVTVGTHLLMSRVTPRRARVFLHPALTTILILMFILKASGTTTDQYRSGGSLLSFFLGPAVVSFALPLSNCWPKIRERFGSLLAVISLAALLGILSVAIILKLSGAETEIIRTLATKSVTSPIAIAIIEKNGGIAELAATVILFVGVWGSIVSPLIFRVFRVRSEAAKGLALGASAHGIGAATAVQNGEECGAMAAIAMALMGIATAIAIPALIALGAI